MRYLLDTHAVIWYYQNSTELSRTAEILIDAATSVITIDENIQKYDVSWIW